MDHFPRDVNKIFAYRGETPVLFAAHTGGDKDKIKSYKEGNKNDTLTEDDNMDYDDIENDFDDEDDDGENGSAFYGRGL